MTAYSQTDLLRLAAGRTVAPEIVMAIFRDPEAVARLAEMTRSMRELFPESEEEELPDLDDPEWDWDAVEAYFEGTLHDAAKTAQVKAVLRKHYGDDAPVPLPPATVAAAVVPRVVGEAWNTKRGVETKDWWIVPSAEPSYDVALADAAPRFDIESKNLSADGLWARGTILHELRDADKHEVLKIRFVLSQGSPIQRAYFSLYDGTSEVTGRRLLLADQPVEFEVPLPPKMMYYVGVYWTHEGSAVTRRISLPNPKAGG